MPSPRGNQRRKKEVGQTPVIDEKGRLQPQAPELERSVLGAILTERDAFSKVSDLLSPDVFYDPRHQRIYQAVLALNTAQKPVDQKTVKEKLVSSGLMDEAGGHAYLQKIVDEFVSSSEIIFESQVIKSKFLARQLLKFSNHVHGMAFDETQDVTDLMQKAEGEIFEISQNSLKKDYVQIDPIMDEAFDLIKAAAKREGNISGLPSGFRDLDRKTLGWQKSDLVIIAARPAMGKTAFVLSMAKNMAIDNGVPVALFSLEMSNVQLINRILSNVSSIESGKIKSGQLTPQEWTQLDMGMKAMYDKPLYVDDSSFLSVFELRTKARRLVREHGVKIIIIDYLQLMNAKGTNFGNRQEEVATISRSLKALAKELNIPIIALSQLNRNVEQRDNAKKDNTENNVAVIDLHKPQLSDLRESGSIEQDADMVCFIHRPEYYKVEEDDKGNSLKGKAQIIIAKHRNGEIGEVTLNFKGGFTRFSDKDDEKIPLPTEGGRFRASRMNSMSL